MKLTKCIHLEDKKDSKLWYHNNKNKLKSKR